MEGQMKMPVGSLKPYTAIAAVMAFLLSFPAVSLAAGGITVIPDSSVWIQVVNFLILIWALNTVLYKPIRRILSERTQTVDGLENTIETAHKDSVENEKAYAVGIKAAREKGLKEKEVLLQEAAEEEKEILQEINEKAQAELAAVKEKIATEAQAVRAELEKEVDVFSKAIGEKILGRAI
jgi:F-type H+-transporting ATPase subunit b